jgi:hypothetical protein
VVAEKSGVVSEELRKLHRNLLGPLGVTSPPATVDEAVAEYRIVRDRRTPVGVVCAKPHGR